MKKNQYQVIGVMSGTSLDGVDLAECRFTFSEETGWDFNLGVTETIPYSSSWKAKLGEGVHFSRGRLSTLNEDYTQLLGRIISEFIEKNKLQNIDAVCSHGHTILHQPEEGTTLQIGNLHELADLVNATVVCDFRVQDVELGGQGAPLVPIGDRLLFGNYDYCLNLGGFANLSFEQNGKRIAFDICPMNIVLNVLAEEMGKPFDEDGKIAANGIVDFDLLNILNQLEYYQTSPPKSLGLEWVNKHIWPILNASEISVEDKIATFTEHAAMQLAGNFEPGHSVLSTGGGTYNKHLMSRLLSYKAVELIIPEPKIIDCKEALVFGLLGVLKLREETNCLASVTGAKADHSSGVIFSV
ncbi:MAG: anhydro-N-acetylmuramic acid kinase [Flavobacteriaceae bacterium]|nr:anhydro-N-acetylmuramic acid kinase [Flavobacteriaceae bacterium]